MAIRLFTRFFSDINYLYPYISCIIVLALSMLSVHYENDICKIFQNDALCWIMIVLSMIILIFSKKILLWATTFYLYPHSHIQNENDVTYN